MGKYDLRLQQHFSFMKGIRIPLQTMNSIALRSNAFNHEELYYTSRQPDNVHQKESFLKTLIRKGNYKCNLFLQELVRSGYKEEVDICLTEHNGDENVNDQLNNVTSEKIEQNLDYIASNLEISIVLDMLFERQIITIDEHDEIQKKSTKPEKRTTLLSLLLDRPSTNWLSGFIRVLQNTGHINLLERLTQHVSNGQELAELPYVAFGQTMPFPNDFIVRLSSSAIQREEFEVITLHTVPVEQIIQEALDSGVIEIWEGSIYFYLSTFSPDTILAILNGKDETKLVIFLQLLFSSNRYLLPNFSKDTVVQFELELEEKPHDIFVDTFYGRWKSPIPTNKDEFCSGCYQATLRTNYKTVLGEIEDDIIQDTLTRLEKLGKPNDQLHSSQCLFKNKTRSEKAFTFLQYVLGNEHVLYEFSKAFEYHSQVELKRVKCRNCSSPEGVLILSKPRKIVFRFTISMNDLGQIEIANIEKKLMTPSVDLRHILDDKTATGLREPLEHMSLEELPGQIEIKPRKRELTTSSVVFELLDDRTDITPRKQLKKGLSLEEFPGQIERKQLIQELTPPSIAFKLLDDRMDIAPRRQLMKSESLKEFRGTCDLRLQQHVSFIAGIDITLQKMSSIAHESGAFNQDEFNYTLRQPDNIHQKGTLLTKLIRKGHDSCKLFLDELARKGYEKEVDKCLSDNDDDDNVNDQLNKVTSEIIEQNVDYIASNLEIGIVLDILFKREIITIDEHDGLQRKSTKSEKRRTLLSLLLRRPNTNWLFGFKRVLQTTGHIILLERLRQHVSNSQELVEQLYVRLGQIRPLPNDFIGRLSGNSVQREEMEVINLQMVQQVIQEALDSDVIDIWEGSIYLYLSTFSPDIILAILNGKDDAKLILFLQLLFSRDTHLLHQFSSKTAVQFKLEEKPQDIFIDTLYGKWKSQIPTNKDEFCSGCYQGTLRANYKTVLDEIEDDIIQDILTRLEKLGKPNDQLHSSQCLLKNKTRSEKAFTFLQYVLGNEHVLYEFSKAFEYHSQVELKRVKCRNCSSPKGVLILSEPWKIVFHFTISMNDFGQIEITTIEKELTTPSFAFRPLDDKTATPLRKPLEHVSLEELPDLTTDKYRIVVIETDDTEFLRELQILTGHQIHVCRIPEIRFGRITWESITRFRDCISFASQGPHALLFVTELDNTYSLGRFLDYFFQCHGYDLMQFLIPIFTTNSKDDAHLLRKAEHIVESHIPQAQMLRLNTNRFIVYNKTTIREKAVQIDELTKLIARMQIENRQTYDTNMSFEKSTKAVQKSEKVDQKIIQPIHPEITTPEDVYSLEDTLGTP